MNAKTLSELRIGDRGKVTGFALTPDIRQRLMELGLTKGAVCELLRFAPMGDPLEVKIRGYNLSLRKAEAQGILVEVL